MIALLTGPRASTALSLLCLVSLLGCTEGSDEPLGGPSTHDPNQPRVERPTIDLAAASAPIAPHEDPVSVEGRYRGFNHQGMYKEVWGFDAGFPDADFQLMADLGFNYVRLPLDYLTYTSRDDWFRFYEEELEKIDHGIWLGQKYGLHVSLNLHGAPGYCAHGEADTPVPPGQDLDLWADREAQEAFVAHWRMFAERYRDIPPEYLSFNLVNEPDYVDQDVYLGVMLEAVDAIREVTPDRKIVLDGTEFGRRLFPDLDPSIGQSLHVYDPFRITHYGADWVEGSSTWPEPSWPPTPLGRYLYGPLQRDIAGPLAIQGDFAAGTEITLHVERVSDDTDLEISAGDEVVFEHEFRPGPGDGDEWAEANYVEAFDIYQNLYDRAYTTTLPAAADEVTFEATSGDWISLYSITITAPGRDSVILYPEIYDWGVPQPVLSVDANGRVEPVTIPEGFEDDYDWAARYDEWIALAESGVDVVVGEFGVYYRAPHDVTVAFLEDHLKLFEAAGFGWCMWEMAGDFGIFDGSREDIDYAPYGNRVVDQEVLDLLQRY